MNLRFKILVGIILSTVILSFELTLCEEVPYRDELPPIQGFDADPSSEASGQFPSTRELLQSRERRNCSLSRRERREILDADRRWVVNSTILESVNGDLQEIINCTSPGDIILLNLTEVFTPSSALVFDWNITLSAYTPDSTLQNGVYPRSRTKTRMSCTNGESVISVRTDHILLANLEFLNCRQSANGPAIVDVRNCTSGTGIVRFHHVRFFNNRHRSGGPVGIEFQKPSCYSSELIDVQFLNNTCTHRFLADLAPENHLRDIEVIGNQWTRLWPLSAPAMIYIGSNSYSSFEGIRAVDNEGSVLWSTGGEVNLTNSSFEENTGGRVSNGRTFSAGFTVQNATGGLIQNISFMMNTAEAGAGMSVFSSNIQIEDAVFEENAGLPAAGGLFITDESTVNLTYCSFMTNTADTNGGAILVNTSSTIQIVNSSFQSNTAAEHGALFVEESELLMDNCSFLQNTVNDSGAAVALFLASASVSHSLFEENSAVRRGGAWSSTESTVQILDSNFTRNAVTESGGAISHVEANNLTIANSTFLLNSGTDGAAIVFNSPSYLNCSNLTFQENSASEGGGGILTGEFSIFEISNSMFFNNSATHGGGIKLGVHSIFQAVSNNFSLNQASESGSGIFVDRNCSLLVDYCVFLGSYSRFGAGIRMVRESSLILNNSWFENTSVEKNGAGVYSDEAAFMTVERSTFLNNYADMGGGLFAYHDSEVNISDSVFRNNTANGNGGALNVGENGQLKLTNVAFFENNANFGAGLELGSYSRLNVSDSLFRANHAGHTGGGIFVKFSVINVAGSEFYENSAGEGCGAIFFEASNAIVQSCIVSNNTAGLSGGGILTVENDRTDILDSILSGNEAPMGSGLYLENSLAFGQNVSFLDNKGQMGGAVDLNLSSSFLCRRCEFLRNSASEDGGAIFISSVGNRGLAYQFEDCGFEQNEAVFGGVIHFIQDHRRNKECSSRNVNCSFLAFTGNRMIANRASQAGGAFLTNNPALIRYDCNPVLGHQLDFMEEAEFESLPLLTNDSSCPEWRNNSVQEGGYGELYGTFAERIVLTLEYTNGTEETIHETIHNLNDIKSGLPMPAMHLRAEDAFQAGPAIAQVKDLSASLSSPDGFFPGNIIQNMSTGEGNFSELTAFREPRQYHLHINFTDQSLENLTIVIQIRKCRVGEEVTANGTFCQECDATSFNFDPNSRCQRCPDDANCTQPFILPNKGFWHQHPCSSHVQECMSTAACDYEDRTDKLANLTERLNECPDGELEEYTRALCREGYKGVLCGSCDDDYGLSDSFECQKCRHAFVSVLVLALSTLWVLLLSTFAVRCGLSVHAVTRRGVPRPVPHEEQLPSSSGSVNSDSQINMEMVEMMVTGHVPPERLSQQQPLPQQRQPQALTPRQVAHRINISKWRCTEIYKITINYLQVIGIAVSINTDWNQTIFEFLRTTEALSGFASEASTRSVDCIVPSGSSVSKSVVRTTVSLVVPLVALILLCSFWMFVRVRAGHSMWFWLKRSTLSFLAVLYISYIALTKTLIRILYCVEVHDSFDKDSDESSRYWAMDTSLKCYEGKHLVLTVLFSLPLLFLLTILFPVLSACILVRFRNNGSLKSDGVYETMGFMFRAYREKYVFWESIILLRKALLAVIVVYAYPLGGNLQGTLAVSVLVLASYMHHVCSPFSSDMAELNELEGLSLLISSLTFVVGFFFNDDKTSEGVRVMLTVFIMICNIGLFLFFASVMFVRGIEHMRVCLNPDDPASNANTLNVVRAYFSLQFFVFQRRIQTMASK